MALPNNPFTLSFGKEPKEYIIRTNEYREIIEAFSSDNPVSNVFIITGVRGSGKTVLLSSLYKCFDIQDDFVAVDLNTRVDMLEALASSIYDKTPIKHRYLKPEFSFSFSGISLSLKGEKPVSSISQLLEQMLLIFKKAHKKLLITVDDIDTGDNMKTFVKEFQSLYRKDLPVYLIATGLYSAVDVLEQQEGLTFLQRGQKRYLAPLNIRYIASSYREIFNISEEESITLANLTKGYAFAYQTLGYLFFESKERKIDEKLLREYDYYLEEYVYRRLYSDLPDKEKRILMALSINKLKTNKELVDAGVITNQEIYRYKDRLSKRGICDISTRGEIKIILPRFEDFISFQASLGDF